jgi:hypothetical protein
MKYINKKDSNESKGGTDLDQSFPPLVPTLKPAQALSSSAAIPVDSSTNKSSTLTTTSITIVPSTAIKQEAVVKETKPEEKQQPTNTQTTAQTTTQTSKKSKYEYLKNLAANNTQSVIFLDEVIPKKPSASKLAPTEEKNDEVTTKQRRDTHVSDIKFGFMDSSSEEAEEHQQANNNLTNEEKEPVTNQLPNDDAKSNFLLKNCC